MAPSPSAAITASVAAKPRMLRSPTSPARPLPAQFRSCAAARQDHERRGPVRKNAALRVDDPRLAGNDAPPRPIARPSARTRPASWVIGREKLALVSIVV